MANIALLEKTLKHIEGNVEAWNQSHWRSVPGLEMGKPELLPTICGTAMCFAGEAIQLNNAEDWIVQPEDIKKAAEANDRTLLDRLYWMLEYVYATPDEGGSSGLHPITREPITYVGAEFRGRHVLGLDYDTATMLFHENNTLEDLQDMVAYIREHDSLTGYEVHRDD